MMVSLSIVDLFILMFVEELSLGFIFLPSFVSLVSYQE